MKLVDTVNDIVTDKWHAGKKEKSEWVKYYEEQAIIRKEKQAPKMSAVSFQHLQPLRFRT